MAATRGALAPRRHRHQTRPTRHAAKRSAKTPASSGSKRRSRRCASSSTRSAAAARKAELVAGGGALDGVGVQLRCGFNRRLQPQTLKRRAPVIVALHVADALAAQDRGLTGGLDTFGDGMEPEALGKPQQMAEEHLVVGAAAEIADEGAVDLDGVDRQGLQMPQRGVAGAEIVERDATTGLRSEERRVGKEG